MKWWQQILVNFFTNKWTVLALLFIIVVLILHVLGYHVEVWLDQFFRWLWQNLKSLL